MEGENELMECVDLTEWIGKNRNTHIRSIDKSLECWE